MIKYKIIGFNQQKIGNAIIKKNNSNLNNSNLNVSLTNVIVKELKHRNNTIDRFIPGTDIRVVKIVSGPLLKRTTTGVFLFCSVDIEVDNKNAVRKLTLPDEFYEFAVIEGNATSDRSDIVSAWMYVAMHLTHLSNSKRSLRQSHSI